MQEIGLEVLKNYGLFAFLVIALLAFVGHLHTKILHHFMTEVREKDKNILEMGTKFSCSLDANTRAMNELCKAELELANESKNVVEGFDRLAEQNRTDHSRILDHVIASQNRGRM